MRAASFFLLFCVFTSLHALTRIELENWLRAELLRRNPQIEAHELQINILDPNLGWKLTELPTSNFNIVLPLPPKLSLLGTRTLSLQVSDINTKRILKVKIYSQAQVSACVSARRLAAEQTLVSGDLKIESKNLQQVRFLRDCQTLLGKVPKINIDAETILSQTLFAPPLIVRKGERLTGIYERNGLRLQIELISLQTGRAGDWIQVQNPRSGKRFSAKLMPDRTVTVESDSSIMMQHVD